MSENLELRRQALEATGWRFLEDRSQPYWLFVVHPNNNIEIEYATKQNLSAFTGSLRHLNNKTPAVESDPGASETWFLEWCEKQVWYRFAISANSDGAVHIELIWDERHQSRIRRVVSVSGATLSEARCLAVIAAAKKGQTWATCTPSIA